MAISKEGEEAIFEADAIVFAVGVGAMQRIVASSPVLSGRPEFANINQLGTVDVSAVRLWLDRCLTLTWLSFDYTLSTSSKMAHLI